VTDGIGTALEKAKLASRGRGVKIGGSVEKIDELHFAVSPVVLGIDHAMHFVRSR
jgi:hypothetical protein